MTPENENQSKLPYEKPRLRTIPLAAEEVLGVSCKTAAGAPGKNGAPQGCGFAPCSVPGQYGS